jgi:membrane protein YqaA with SNARE-associated domain
VRRRSESPCVRSPRHWMTALSGLFFWSFALPNLIPLPPGATMVLGLPMIFVAWQVVIGYQKVWLPRAIADYAIDRATFQRMVARVSPWLRNAENWVRPRNWPLDGAVRERLFGVFALLLSIICVCRFPSATGFPPSPSQSWASPIQNVTAIAWRSACSSGLCPLRWPRWSSPPQARCLQCCFDEGNSRFLTGLRLQWAHEPQGA